MSTVDTRDDRILIAAKYLNRHLKEFENNGSQIHHEIEEQLRTLKGVLSVTPDSENEGQSDAVDSRPASVQKVASHKNRGSGNRGTKTAAMTTRRVEGILTHFELEPVTAAEVGAILTGSLTQGKQHAEVEDAALGILFRGYKEEDIQTYTKALGGLSLAVLHSSKSLKAARERSMVTDQLADESTRMQTRHKHLDTLAGHLHAGSWTLRTMCQIEALKFAADWRGCEPATKRRFYEDAFCAREEIKAQVEDLEDADRKAMLRKGGELEEEFRRWKRANEREVTGRNRLWTLYNLFGAAVIIDPTWSVESLGMRCSRTFCHVLEELAQSIPQGFDPDTDEHSARVTLEYLYEHGRHALRCIVQVLHPDPVFMRYVTEFLDDHPPGEDIE